MATTYTRANVESFLLGKLPYEPARRTLSEAVSTYYGAHRLEIESYPLHRLRVHGRTVATGESEREMWEEAFEHIADLVEQDYHDCGYMREVH